MPLRCLGHLAVACAALVGTAPAADLASLMTGSIGPSRGNTSVKCGSSIANWGSCRARMAWIVPQCDSLKVGYAMIANRGFTGGTGSA